jgi:hypothetical protein
LCLYLATHQKKFHFSTKSLIHTLSFFCFIFNFVKFVFQTRKLVDDGGGYGSTARGGEYLLQSGTVFTSVFAVVFLNFEVVLLLLVFVWKRLISTKMKNINGVVCSGRRNTRS